MGRIRTGIRLTGASWRVVRTERSLLAFPVLAALFGIGYLLAVILPLAVVGYVVVGDYVVVQLVVLFLMLLGTSIGATFFGVAAAANASALFDGRDPTLGDGIRVARSRFGVIVTRPSEASRMIASRTGVLDMPREATNAPSSRSDPGANARDRMRSRKA